MYANEAFYQEYRRDRDNGLSHAQIVADGCYPADLLEAFCMRFDLAQSAYVDAMRGKPLRLDSGDPVVKEDVQAAQISRERFL